MSSERAASWVCQQINVIDDAGVRFVVPPYRTLAIQMDTHYTNFYIGEGLMDEAIGHASHAARLEEFLVYAATCPPRPKSRRYA